MDDPRKSGGPFNYEPSSSGKVDDPSSKKNKKNKKANTTAPRKRRANKPPASGVVGEPIDVDRYNEPPINYTNERTGGREEAVKRGRRGRGTSTAPKRPKAPRQTSPAPALSWNAYGAPNSGSTNQPTDFWSVYKPPTSMGLYGQNNPETINQLQNAAIIDQLLSPGSGRMEQLQLSGRIDQLLNPTAGRVNQPPVSRVPDQGYKPHPSGGIFGAPVLSGRADELPSYFRADQLSTSSSVPKSAKVKEPARSTSKVNNPPSSEKIKIVAARTIRSEKSSTINESSLRTTPVFHPHTPQSEAAVHPPTKQKLQRVPTPHREQKQPTSSGLYTFRDVTVYPATREGYVERPTSRRDETRAIVEPRAIVEQRAIVEPRAIVEKPTFESVSDISSLQRKREITDRVAERNQADEPHIFGSNLGFSPSGNGDEIATTARADGQPSYASQAEESIISNWIDELITKSEEQISQIANEDTSTASEPVDESQISDIVYKTLVPEIENEPPTSEMVEELPTSELVEEPTTSEMVEELPTSEIVEEPPTSEIVKEPPTSEMVKESPTSEMVEEPPTSEIVELPTSEIVKEPPTSEMVEELPTSEIVEEPPTSEIVKELPTSEMVEVPPTSEMVEELPVSEIVEEQPTSEMVKELPVSEIVEEQPTSEMVEELPTSEIVEEPPTSEIVKELPTSEMVEVPPTSEMVEVPPTSEMVEVPPTSEMVEELPTSEIVKELPTSEMVEVPPTSEMVELPTSEIVDELTTSEMVEVPPTSEMVEELPISEIVKELPTSEIVEELPTSEIVEELPTSVIVEKLPNSETEDQTAKDPQSCEIEKAPQPSQSAEKPFAMNELQIPDEPPLSKRHRDSTEGDDPDPKRRKAKEQQNDEKTDPSSDDKSKNREMLQRIEEAGHLLHSTYCSPTPSQPTMLPPVLNMGAQSHVKVYHTFRSSKKKMLVLHGLQYTNKQFALFKPNRTDFPCDDNELDNEKGRSDFVLIGENFVLIVEVSDLNENDGLITVKQIRSVLTAKEKQGAVTEDLVREMIRSSDKNVVTSPVIQRFCAFPNLSKTYASNLTAEELSRVILSEDLTPDTNFSAWWEKNVAKTSKTPQGIFKYTKEVLVGLWDYLAFSWWGRVVTNALKPSEETMTHLSKLLIGLWDINSQDDANMEIQP